MRPAPPAGDLALTARPASADTFAPFGRILGVGDRARLGRRGAVLATLEEVHPGPRRFTHLQRYPEARRLLLPLSDVGFLVLVLGPGDPPAGPPAAFRTAPGQGLLIGAGIWHAGPVALGDGAICELLETRGRIDHLDRRPLFDLAGVEGIRLQLSDEPGAPGPGLDLEAPGAVLVEEGLAGRLILGLLLLDDLDVASESLALAQASHNAAEAARSLVGPGRTPGSALGAAVIRRLWTDLGLKPDKRPTPYEALLREVLEGAPVPAPDTLRGAMALCSLRRQVAYSVHDAGPLTAPLQLRFGREKESLDDDGGRPASVRGTPILSDRDGPFAGPVGSARRVCVGPGVHRALIALYLPAGTTEGDVLLHLEEASRVIREFCGGHEVGRLVV